jgi:aspartate aminotransferase-like enzyme
MKKSYLLTPGPTPLPPKVRQAAARPIIHHRTPQFQEILRKVFDSLKYVFQTESEVFIFAASGTGAMEAAVTNLLSAQDTAITVEGGKFGERWREICNAYGVKTEVIKVEWGKAVDPGQIAAVIKEKGPGVKAVFVTLCETSTGVTTDIEAIGKIVKATDAVLVVDAISGLAATDLKTDAWSVDMVIAGSQKGLMLPPGLAFISVSPKAWNLIKNSKIPKYYFSLLEAKKAYDKTDTVFTPAISLIIALNEALTMIKEEGLENLFRRHYKMAQATRVAIKALGLELFTEKNALSDTLTAVKVPPGIDGIKLVKTMRDVYKVTSAG